MAPVPVEPVPSSTDTAASLEVEHEEGEIEDDDDEEDQRAGLEYENISSDEEFIIRERILQLEAKNSEMERQKNRNAAAASGRIGHQGAAARHNGMIKEFALMELSFFLLDEMIDVILR